jgi:hypothetical protein
VYTTWQINFEKLSPIAAQFLQMCSLLHYDNIPEGIFKEAAAWKIKDEEDIQTVQEARAFLQNFLSASGTWDPLFFMDILAEIEGYSLLNKHAEDTFSIHPLVHSWCQTTLEDVPKARECMMDILGMAVMLTEGADLFRIGLMLHVESLIQNPAIVKPVFQDKYAQIYFDSGRFKEAELIMGILTYSKSGKYQKAEPLKATVL